MFNIFLIGFQDGFATLRSVDSDPLHPSVMFLSVCFTHAKMTLMFCERSRPVQIFTIGRVCVQQMSAKSYVIVLKPNYDVLRDII